MAKFKGKSSFLLSDFQFKVGYRDRVIAFLCFKAFFFLRINTQFIVHRTIDYPQVIGLIKEKTVITKCVTKTLTNKNGQTFVEMVKKMYFFT